MVGRLKSFKPSKNDSGEHVLGLLERIERDFENLEVCKNFNYFLAILFLKESFENGVLNEMEKRNIQDLISNKTDREIMSEIKKEFKKIKIEGKREFEHQNSDSEENKTFFVNNKNRSRYDSWKGSRDFKEFRRTGSNNWRTQSGNRWRKAQSVTRSGSRPRSVSWSREKNSEFRSLKDFQNMVLKEIKSLKDRQDQIVKTQDDMMAKVVDSKCI